MPRTDNPQTKSARAGARRLIEQVPKALAGLIGMCGLGYLAGSFYTRAYFSEFGASWILEEVPAATYYGQSWVPPLLILYLGYLVTTNLARIDSGDDLTTGTRFHLSVAVVQYGSWGLFSLLAIIPLLSTFDSSTPAIILALVAVVLLLVLLSSVLELVVVRFWTGNRSMDFSMVYIAVAVIAVGLYVIPTQLGMNWARLDKQPNSTLLRVHLHPDEMTEYKLLYAVGERLYIFPTTFQGNRPLVQATAVTNVRFVPPSR
jgi:uncharacterized membrane protein YqjE